ncbi:PREDICTED: ankyrin repeat domain-containing protein 29-like [Leptosomus discolor]|uniref:ankyrin repeat domain-containing protein 29-like n=1 Tax=Leptosomus discolor TaxID=188344 RepID=UPI0005229258|nr:PREDICTED: ankyrin repeat domain-containing protein 29-like [Leptosomus discolor]
MGSYRCESKDDLHQQRSQFLSVECQARFGSAILNNCLHGLAAPCSKSIPCSYLSEVAAAGGIGVGFKLAVPLLCKTVLTLGLLSLSDDWVESGATSLFFAAQQGHNDVVKFLFEFGASTEFKNKDGGTALLAACQYGHAKVVETLLKHGANIHDQLYDGASAIFLAAQGGYLDVIRLLLSSGAKVNQPRQDGTAPLWIASQMGHSEVVRVMLLRGAERDAARDDGTTALLKAAIKGYNNVIEELLKFSPTLGLLKNGTSALHAAVLSGNVRTVALLLEAGADPCLRNKANELPAELTKNERILRLLRTKEKQRKS